MNITEDYVSFEVAKLLKEKGFITPCKWLYCKNGTFGHISSLWDKEMFPAPTLQMAMKWLREKYQLLISVDASPIYGKVKDEKGGNTCGLLYWHYMASGEWMNDKYNPQQKAFVVSEKSYEQAVETALKYVLENLI